MYKKHEPSTLYLSHWFSRSQRTLEDFILDIKKQKVVFDTLNSYFNFTEIFFQRSIRISPIVPFFEVTKFKKNLSEWFNGEQSANIKQKCWTCKLERKNILLLLWQHIKKYWTTIRRKQHKQQSTFVTHSTPCYQSKKALLIYN